MEQSANNKIYICINKIRCTPPPMVIDQPVGLKARFARNEKLIFYRFDFLSLVCLATKCSSLLSLSVLGRLGLVLMGVTRTGAGEKEESSWNLASPCNIL